MNETPNTPAPTAAPQSSSVSEALTTLQLQLQATLIILIMLSGALNLYLYRQFSTLRKEVAAIEPQVAQLNDGYQRATVPLKNKFLSLLTDYTKTHPDFQPIMDKYGIQAAPTAAVPAAARPASNAATAPTPAKAAAPAKASATKTPTPATAPKK
jgi:hypothetical protein